MSAHTRLATTAAWAAAVADLLARVGHPGAPTTTEFYAEDQEVHVRAYVPIADEPMNGANEVFAGLVARCAPSKRATVAAYSEHRLTQDGHSICWCDNFRFETPGGMSWMAPRTLAVLVVEAMNR